ncbi:hypothetical protein [Aeromicrobium sp. A1-2]|uniref:hypothetical protein n=1 Tax=Aeromicrobium sp. A1-2 TaxID=2107713 RepID=UPI001C200EF6|nr:hypothetical protein [Aeromicrobium sp. A1-2]
MTKRSHHDRCPGVLRPWIADDGALIRVRLIGGVLPTTALRALVEIADRFADGTIHLTKRTNLQLRGIAHTDGSVPDELVSALTATGLLPSPSHELVRNIMVSPLTGRVGARPICGRRRASWTDCCATTRPSATSPADSCSSSTTGAGMSPNDHSTWASWRSITRPSSCASDHSTGVR